MEPRPLFAYGLKIIILDTLPEKIQVSAAERSSLDYSRQILRKGGSCPTTVRWSTSGAGGRGNEMIHRAACNRFERPDRLLRSAELGTHSRCIMLRSEQ